MLKGQGAHGPGWGFGSENEEWASLIAEVVRFKTQKRNETTYRRQDRNWLAVYDNTPQPARGRDSRYLDSTRIEPTLRLAENRYVVRASGSRVGVNVIFSVRSPARLHALERRLREKDPAELNEAFCQPA